MGKGRKSQMTGKGQNLLPECEKNVFKEHCKWLDAGLVGLGVSENINFRGSPLTTMPLPKRYLKSFFIPTQPFLAKCDLYVIFGINTPHDILKLSLMSLS